MKKNISILLLLLLFFIEVDVRAQEWGAVKNGCHEASDYLNERNFYGKIFGGANFLENSTFDGNKPKYHTGYVVAGSIGYYWCYGLRIEGEYAYRKNAIRKIYLVGQYSSSHGHFQASSYMANLVWNFPLSYWGYVFYNIQPFVGAGIGYDFQKMNSSNFHIDFHQKWKHFSWQLMVGLAYPVFCHTDIALEYKFHQGGCHFYNHSIGVAIAYKFGFSR